MVFFSSLVVGCLLSVSPAPGQQGDSGSLKNFSNFGRLSLLPPLYSLNSAGPLESDPSAFLTQFGSGAPVQQMADPAAGNADNPTVVPAEKPAVQAPEDKRIFGVLPNNRTTENSIPFHKITGWQKMTIAAKDSFDWPVYPTSALFATLYQLDDDNPSFGQGMAGYAKRIASAYGDQMIGNMMTEGIVPAVFHQDPRYFRLGVGTKKSRALYALSRIVIARMDSGRNTFNFSEWGGNAAAAAISNAYYPDTRNWNDNLQKLLIACGTDAFSNVLKEFWPDVKRKLHHHREEEPLTSSR